MSEELRPCPFCGEMNILARELREEIEYFGCIHTQLMERDLWNTRPIEDALTTEIGMLDLQLIVAIEALRWYARSNEGEWKAGEALVRIAELEATK